PYRFAAAGPITDGLVGWWKFNEGSGSTAGDSSGNDWDGTLVNMSSSNWVSGFEGDALEFDGSNQYVNCGAVSRNSVYSLSAFVIADSKSGRILALRANSVSGSNWQRANFIFSLQ